MIDVQRTMDFVGFFLEILHIELRDFGVLTDLE